MRVVAFTEPVDLDTSEGAIDDAPVAADEDFLFGVGGGVRVPPETVVSGPDGGGDGVFPVEGPVPVSSLVKMVLWQEVKRLEISYVKTPS